MSVSPRKIGLSVSVQLFLADAYGTPWEKQSANPSYWITAAVASISIIGYRHALYQAGRIRFQVQDNIKYRGVEVAGINRNIRMAAGSCVTSFWRMERGNRFTEEWPCTASSLITGRSWRL
jgi:hypothetical protein